jgi:hypothetical protein
MYFPANASRSVRVNRSGFRPSVRPGSLAIFAVMIER